jgi:hypothetical protein
MTMTDSSKKLAVYLGFSALEWQRTCALIPSMYISEKNTVIGHNWVIRATANALRMVMTALTPHML